MATIRSYTTIEQSKVLAKILPLDSADMWWLYVTAQGKHIAMMYEEPDPHYIARMESYGIKDAAIRCWSLAALLDVLPSGYVIVKNYHGFYYVESRDHSKVTNIFDNPIGACVAMIIELHKLNLL